MRIPALLLGSILVVNALFFPGARDVVVSLGPLSVSREGLTFGVVSAGRLLVAFVASVAFLFTTLADDLLETLVARGASHRIAFVILSAVQIVPRMQERAGSILEAQQARGLSRRGFLRAPGPGTRAAHRTGAAGVPGRRPRADVCPRGSRLRGEARDGPPIGVVADPPIDRWLRLLILLCCAGTVVAALTGILG